MEASDKFNNNNTSHEQQTDREVIIESNSLLCDAQAFVEKYSDCYYFYIIFDTLGLNPYMEAPKIKMCWICNRLQAPSKLDIDSMNNGKGPMMPAQFVDHDLNGIDLDEDNLSVVWFEDGASAALLCGEEIICVIPGWSGYQNFHGYSKYAKGTGIYAWEISHALPLLTKSVKQAQNFWSTFAKDEQSAWNYLYKQAPEIKDFVGNHEQDFNIAHKNDKHLGKITFPPKIVISGSRDGVVYGITVGVSLPAMPDVQCDGGDPKDLKRIEFGFAAVEDHRTLCHPMYGNLSMYACLPWHDITFLAHGHTFPLNNLKGFGAVLFVNSRFIQGLESPHYPNFMDGGIINTLWVVPISQEEYNFVVKNGIEELMKKAKDPAHIHIFDGDNKFSL